MNTVRGKRAVVTGGLSGIGRAVATLLAERGASVAIFDNRDHSRDDGIEGIEFAKRLGECAFFVHGDVTNEGDVQTFFDNVVCQFGTVDIVVNSAGVTVFRPFTEITMEEYDFVMNVNVKGVFLIIKRAVEVMARNEHGGTIVNIASNFGLVGGPETSVYSASKGAIISMTKALAAEVGPLGIRVNALCPGATATEFNRAYRETRPDVVEAWRQKTPLRMPDRSDFLAVASDIAPAAVFLASEDSRYMTGSTLLIDGGWNAQ